MNPNFRMNTQNLQRQRPLQKSMILPDHYSSHTYIYPQQVQQNLVDKSSLHLMKRSSINFQQQYSEQKQQFVRQQFNNNIQGYSQLHNTPQQNLSNDHNYAYNFTPIKNITAQVQGETKLSFQTNSQRQLKSGNSLNLNKQKIIQDIINLLKQQHLPIILKQIHKQFYDQLYNLRVQLKTFKNQVISDLEKKIQQKYSNILDSKAKVVNKNMSNKQITDLQRQFFLLQGKIKTIQSKIEQQNKKYQKDITSLNTKQLSQKISVSLTKSSIPPLFLQYREIFKISGIQANKKQQQIVISNRSYYIDRQGYLLDNQSRYLVDTRGVRIRLGQPQIKLLETHKILYN